MKKLIRYLFSPTVLLMFCFNIHFGSIIAQDDGVGSEEVIQNDDIPDTYKAKKTVKTPFKSVMLVDNQTTTVPVKGTSEMDIQHRFETFLNGWEDFIGIYASSNIRIGYGYVPVDNLMLGFGLTKERMQMDFNAKYAIVQQKKGGWPINITYYGNMVLETRNKKFYRNGTDRLSYFNQLIFSSRVHEYFSVQVSPTISWFNNVEGYVDNEGEIQKKMNNAHIGLSMMGRVKINDKLAVTVGYDQPMTKHFTNNPNPNISLGLEMTTSGHSFQVFVQNYHGINPQSSNFYNDNDYQKGEFLLGFNITRLWN